MPTTGEIMAISTILFSVISMLGITGIDAATVNSAVTGAASVLMIATSVWAYISHRNAVKATQ